MYMYARIRDILICRLPNSTAPVTKGPEVLMSSLLQNKIETFKAEMGSGARDGRVSQRSAEPVEDLEGPSQLRPRPLPWATD